VLRREITRFRAREWKYASHAGPSRACEGRCIVMAILLRDQGTLTSNKKLCLCVFAYSDEVNGRLIGYDVVESVIMYLIGLPAHQGACTRALRIMIDLL
jgi:hypothetical protein